MKICSRAISIKERAAAGIICVMMLVMIILAAFFVAFETEHECTGEDCPVCDIIRLCENTLHQAADVSVPLSFAGIVIVLFLMRELSAGSDLPKVTLVSQKIRMDD